MEQVAKFYIDDKFIITGRGLAFVGHVVEGLIRTGNYIEFNFNGDIIKRKINGIELTSNSIHSEGVFDKKNTGIMIECENAEEMKRIRQSNLKNVEALIFEEK